jgi:3-dehydroquinate synthase
VAATYLRGIRFIQIPTTLLAQVDSSVGGKTGFNLKAGKNLVGAFYQPAKVLIDPLFIKTLPPKEIRSGMAEVIKYGCILDRSFLNYLSLGLSLGLKQTISRKEFLETIIEKSCQWKAYVVAKDEKENNLRAILNFGHTLGHALEGASQYKGLSHGEWVALGMIFASRLSLKLKKIDQNDVLFLEKMFQNAGYVWHLNKFPFSKIEKYLWQDKKISSTKLTWIIPETRLGKVQITDKISYQLVKQTYTELQKDYK